MVLSNYPDSHEMTETLRSALVAFGVGESTAAELRIAEDHVRQCATCDAWVKETQAEYAAAAGKPKRDIFELFAPPTSGVRPRNPR